jgi:hypothetical protein
MFRHAELEQPAPYLIRGHPDIVPMKIGTGMTILPEGIIYKQTLMNYPLIPPSPPGKRGKVMGSAFLLSYSGPLPVSRAGYETPAIFPSPPEQPPEELWKEIARLRVSS